MKKVYISGPISGLPREEYIEMFEEAERVLRAQGYRVLNPTRLAPCRWPWLYKLLGYRLTLAYDLWHLKRCRKIYKIPGWQQSRGARLESMKAHQWGIREYFRDVEVPDIPMDQHIQYVFKDYQRMYRENLKVTKKCKQLRSSLYRLDALQYSYAKIIFEQHKEMGRLMKIMRGNGLIVPTDIRDHAEAIENTFVRRSKPQKGNAQVSE